MDEQTKRNIYDSVMREVNTLARELLTEKYVPAGSDDMFEEVVCNYFDEELGMWTVDAWEPIEDEEEENQGRVIAYLDPETFSVTWIDAAAVSSRLANEVIDEKIEQLEHELS